jgi:Holliday junction resolvase RusA-like endonuclease
MNDIRLTIRGQPPRKSNSRRIVTNRRTRRPMLVKSREALAWMQSARLQVPDSARIGLGSKERPVRVACWVRYATRRPDLSIELVLDLLEDAGVISNDRWVYETHAYKAIDPEDPGVDICIEECS